MIKKFNEFLNDLLLEKLSPVLWHFCDFDSMLEILKSNKFKLSESNVDRDEMPGITGYSDKRKFYMCFTRSKNSQEGYSRIYSDEENLDGFVRITVDGDKLNNITRGKSSDYFGSRYDDVLGKRKLYKNIEKGKYNSIDQIYNQKYGPIQDNEKEDTLWYKKPEIIDINKYIKRIDVYISTEKSFNDNLEMFNEMKEKSDMLNIPIFFYNDLKDFDKQNNNILDIEKERI